MKGLRGFFFLWQRPRGRPSCDVVFARPVFREPPQLPPIGSPCGRVKDSSPKPPTPSRCIPTRGLFSRGTTAHWPALRPSLNPLVNPALETTLLVLSFQLAGISHSTAPPQGQHPPPMRPLQRNHSAWCLHFPPSWLDHAPFGLCSRWALPLAYPVRVLLPEAACPCSPIHGSPMGHGRLPGEARVAWWWPLPQWQAISRAGVPVSTFFFSVCGFVLHLPGPSQALPGVRSSLPSWTTLSVSAIRSFVVLVDLLINSFLSFV